MSIDPASSPVAAVRFLIGDLDPGGTGDPAPVLADSEILFALSAAQDDIYAAAAICARALAGRYASQVDTRFETVESKYSQLSMAYAALAIRLDAQSRRFGSRGLGVPIGGGISISEMETVRANTDRNGGAFARDQFTNPPPTDHEG